MSVEFNENKPMNYGYEPRKGGLVQLVIKLGLAKDEAKAEKVLIFATAIFFILSFYLFYKAL